MSAIHTIHAELRGLLGSVSLNTVVIDSSSPDLVVLKIGEDSWMNTLVSTDDSHALLNELAYGDVLLGGLGLGGDILLLRDNPNVDNIHVVESDPDVIELVWSKVSDDYPHLTIEQDTLSHFAATTQLRFDTIWPDIFVQPMIDIPEEQAELISLLTPLLRTGGKILFWQDQEEY